MNDLLLNAWSAIAHDTDGPPVLKIPRANLAELVDELGRLHRWKAEAIDVMTIGLPPSGAWLVFDADGLLAAFADENDTMMDSLQARIRDMWAEIERLRAEVADLHDGINWHTECLNCARLMNDNYDQLCEIERLRAMTAEQALVHDAWMTERALADQLAGALSADPQQDMGIGRRAALASHEEARRAQ